MSERPPTFDELFAPGELQAAERERLVRVHELLVAAGPPPELSPELQETPEPPAGTVAPLVRRRRYAALGLAAALALALFGTGYAVGRGTGGAEPEFTVPMTGGGGASASLAVFPNDEAGNWPMTLRVRGLPPPPAGHRYQLWLTRHGKLAAQCGSFVVHDGENEVPLNAPFRLRTFTGWVVVVDGYTDFVLETKTV